MRLEDGRKPFPSAPASATMRAAFLLCVVVPLVGCVAPGAGPAAEAADAATAAHLEKDVSLTGCLEVGAGRFVSFDRARDLLPAGFEPADAAGFLGMPAPAGRSAVLSGQLACEGSVLDGGAMGWTDLIVPIERPEVAGLELDDGKLDVYQLSHFTSGAATAALFGSVGFAIFLADVTAEPPALPVSVARAATTVEGEDLLRVEAVGAVEQTFVLDARFWHATSTGLAYVEHKRTPTPLRFGAIVSCAAAEGSPFAEAFGATDCGGPDSFAGAFPEPSDFASTFHHLPGARAGSGN